ncbi:MAG: hypothetical protein Q9201_000949 [Fulgogasparrea decipioides]
MAGRSQQKVDSAMSEIEASGVKGSLSAMQLDVTDETSIQRAAKTVEEKHGRLDALLNNAAVGSMDPDIRTRMRLSMDTNVMGPTMVAAAFRPLLLKSSNPYSIYVSSGMGSLAMLSDQSVDQYRPLPNNAPEDAYRASKAALNMVAILEAKQYSRQGLKVFAMCPGFVVSNLRGTSEEARNGWGGDAKDPEISGKIVLSILQGERDADVGKFVWKDGPSTRINERAQNEVSGIGT